ncbi:MAG: hypothetical protein ABII80_01550 [bacterium]
MVFQKIEFGLNNLDTEGARNSTIYNSLSSLWEKDKKGPQRVVGNKVIDIDRTGKDNPMFTISILDHEHSLGEGIGLDFIGGDVDRVCYGIHEDVMDSWVLAHRVDGEYRSVTVTLKANKPSFNKMMKDLEEVGIPLLEKLFGDK